MITTQEADPNWLAPPTKDVLSCRVAITFSSKAGLWAPTINPQSLCLSLTQLLAYDHSCNFGERPACLWAIQRSIWLASPCWGAQHIFLTICVYWYSYIDIMGVTGLVLPIFEVSREFELPHHASRKWNHRNQFCCPRDAGPLEW